MTRFKTVVAMAAASALFLTACGSGSGSSADGSYKLAFVQGVTGDAFYITMGCAVQEEAKKQGATVDIQGPQKFDPTLQTPVLQSVISSRPNAILIAPTDVSAMQRPIEQATQQDIKVVLVDTTLEDPSIAASAIASDNVGGGEAAFKAIQQLAPQGGPLVPAALGHPAAPPPRHDGAGPTTWPRPRAHQLPGRQADRHHQASTGLGRTHPAVCGRHPVSSSTCRALPGLLACRRSPSSRW